MIFTKNKFFFLLLFGVFFSNEWVFKYKGETFFENDFYNYFPESEWKKTKDNNKRESLFFDFVKHAAGVYEAKVLGLDLNPAVHVHCNFVSRAKAQAEGCKSCFIGTKWTPNPKKQGLSEAGSKNR